MVLLIHGPFKHGVVSVIVCWCKEAPLDFASVFLLSLQAKEQAADVMPLLFWYDDTAKRKEPRLFLAWLCGRSAFIYKAKMHSR